MSLVPLGRTLISSPPSIYLIENLVFKDNTVTLDGYHFKNCAFVNCLLQVTLGNFALEECYFNGWWVTFTGNAMNVCKLATLLDWTNANPLYRPIVAPNGGVTIK